MIEEYDFKDMKSLISSILEKNTQEIPDFPAVMSDTQTLTHLELHTLVLDAVSKLENLNIPTEVNIALRFNDHIKHLVFYFALFKMGITQISINPNDTHKSQKKAISLTNIGLIIQDVTIDDKLLHETLHISGDEEFSPQHIDIKPQKYTDNINNPAIISIGSGTTGEVKVFATQSSTLAYRFKSGATTNESQKGERYYCFSELYYSFPRHQTIRALLKGFTVFLPRSKPECIISFCSKQQINHLLLTGSQAIYLLSQEKKLEEVLYPRLPKLKSLVLSSSLITEPTRQEILSKITSQLFIVYGTNEFGAISMADPKDIDQHPGTVGHIFPKVELTIVDDNGKPCPTGEAGNILVRSSHMTTSYLNNPEATKKAFIAEGYYPGDIGRLTEDGNLIFEGRKDDMMIYLGVNIYPRELESVLETHPNVIEAAAFPLYTGNKEHAPFAVVSVNRPTKELELLEWCTSELGWQKLRHIFFVKELPRNKAGKVLKQVLAKKVVEMMINKKTNNIMA